MTVTTARPVAPGDQLHFVESGMTLDAGEPGLFSPRTVDVPRGTVVTLTEAMIQNSRDRLGHTFLDLVDDEEAQIDRWERVMFRRGPWPEGEQVLRKGSLEALIERDRRRAKVVTHFEGDDLQRELRKIDEELGRPETVTVLGKYATGF